MAKMRCVSRCQFRGDIVKIGDIVDIDEKTLKTDAVARSSFVPEGGDVAKSTDAAKRTVVAGLTREQAELKLKSMRVAVPTGTDDDGLARIFLASVDAAESHRVK